MTLSDSELLNKLTEAISLLIPSIYGIDAGLAPVEPVALHRRYSYMFRYQVSLPDGTVQPMLVKIPHDSWMRSMQESIESEHIRDVIRSEYQTMRAIADAVDESGNSKLFAIRPRALLLEFNALLMDEVPIKMLKSSLMETSIILGLETGWRDFDAYVKLSGEWLNVIHRKYSSGQQQAFADVGIMEKVEQQLNFLASSYRQPPIQLHSLFARLFDCIKMTPIPYASLHHDYHLGNIFVTTDGKVGALDPNWVDNGPIYTDLATLLVYPMTGKVQVLALGLLFRSSLQKRFEQSVLCGYFDDSPVPYPVLYFCCAAAILDKWRDNQEIMQTSTSGIYRIASWFIGQWFRFYFHSLIKDYLERGSNLEKAGFSK